MSTVPAPTAPYIRPLSTSPPFWVWAGFTPFWTFPGNFKEFHQWIIIKACAPFCHCSVCLHPALTPPHVGGPREERKHAGDLLQDLWVTDFTVSIPLCVCVGGGVFCFLVFVSFVSWFIIWNPRVYLTNVNFRKSQHQLWGLVLNMWVLWVWINIISNLRNWRLYYQGDKFKYTSLDLILEIQKHIQGMEFIGQVKFYKV